MKRMLSFCLTFLLCVGVLTTAVFADTGPKPYMDITVINAPENYYLDLLIEHDPNRTYYDNLAGTEGHDPQGLAGLHALESEGWYPALAGGTNAPLFGDLTPSKNGTHHFSYHGLPTTFRIIVSEVGSDHWQATEESFIRTAFATNLTYNYATNSIEYATPAGLVRILEFFSTLIPTLLIEVFVLWLFRFDLKKNRIFFLLLNLATQLFLHLVMGTSLYAVTARFSSYLMFFLPAEFIIFVVELVFCVFLLKGHSKLRRAAYALCANAASFALTFVTLHPLLKLLQRL